MSEEKSKTYRLLQVAKELNVGAETLAEFLNARQHLNVKGTPIDGKNLNEKVSAESYNALLKEFSGEKQLKEKAKAGAKLTTREPAQRRAAKTEKSESRAVTTKTPKAEVGAESLGGGSPLALDPLLNLDNLDAFLQLIPLENSDALEPLPGAKRKVEDESLSDVINDLFAGALHSPVAEKTNPEPAAVIEPLAVSEPQPETQSTDALKPKVVGFIDLSQFDKKKKRPTKKETEVSVPQFSDGPPTETASTPSIEALPTVEITTQPILTHLDVVEKTIAPKVETVMEEKAVAPKVETVVTEKAVTPKVETVIEEKTATPKVETVMEEKTVAPKVETIVEEKAVAPKVETVVEEKTIAPPVEISSQEKNITPITPTIITPIVETVSEEKTIINKPEAAKVRPASRPERARHGANNNKENKPVETPNEKSQKPVVESKPTENKPKDAQPVAERLPEAPKTNETTPISADGGDETALSEEEKVIRAHEHAPKLPGLKIVGKLELPAPGRSKNPKLEREKEREQREKDRKERMERERAQENRPIERKDPSKETTTSAPRTERDRGDRPDRRQGASDAPQQNAGGPGQKPKDVVYSTKVPDAQQKTAGEIDAENKRKRKRKRKRKNDNGPAGQTPTPAPQSGSGGGAPRPNTNTGGNNNNRGPNRPNDNRGGGAPRPYQGGGGGGGQRGGGGGHNPPRHGGQGGPPTAVGSNRPARPGEITSREVQNKIRHVFANIHKGSGRKRQLNRKEKRSKHASYRERQEIERQATSNVLEVTEFLTANELANLMDVRVNDVIAKCMQLGMFVSINQRIDADVISLIAEEFGYSVKFISLDESYIETKADIDEDENAVPRPPIVTVMGHVDHGKTSLLDYIRKANVIAGEAGGITQHIGAYEVTLANGRQITFLDTPGHEAFTAMRARGAQVTDIAIIVIAADDQVMPQTREAITHAQAAGVPMVFAINKVDKPGADPERIKQQLAQMNLLVEDWGGKFQCQHISAKFGEGVHELLEKVALEAEFLNLRANPLKLARGAVIESQLDKGRGVVTTLLVQSGVLRVGDVVLANSHYGRVKAMMDERQQRIKEAGPSTPVQILGLDGLPQAGDKFQVFESEREARELAAKRQQLLREQSLRMQKHISLEEIARRSALGDFKELNLIVKGDVDGSVEALADSLIKLSSEEVAVRIVMKGIGQISESDVLLASASNAIIVGFQVRPSSGARKIAQQEAIDVRLYSVIYDAINEIKDALEGLLAPKIEEEITGTAEVRETFRIVKLGTIAGCMITEGKIARNSAIRLVRDGVVVFTGKLSSLRRFKDDAKEVAEGFECGISIENYNDIKVGDVIESFTQKEVKRTLFSGNNSSNNPNHY